MLKSNQIIKEIEMFYRNEKYPTWNPLKVEDKPAIPIWKTTFGDIHISFEEGYKTCYVNKKKYKKKNILCGDYTIHVTISKKLENEKITDNKFISIITYFSHLHPRDFCLTTPKIWAI